MFAFAILPFLFLTLQYKNTHKRCKKVWTIHIVTENDNWRWNNTELVCFVYAMQRGNMKIFLLAVVGSLLFASNCRSQVPSVSSTYLLFSSSCRSIAMFTFVLQHHHSFAALKNVRLGDEKKASSVAIIRKQEKKSTNWNTTFSFTWLVINI